MLILELLFFQTALINLYLSGYTIKVKLKYFIFVLKKLRLAKSTAPKREAIAIKRSLSTRLMEYIFSRI